MVDLDRSGLLNTFDAVLTHFECTVGVAED